MTFCTLSKRKVEFDESLTLDIDTSSSETVFVLFSFHRILNAFIYLPSCVQLL